MTLVGDEPVAIEALLFRQARAQHVAVLACVLGLDAAEAEYASSQGLLWDERRGVVTVRLSEARTERFAIADVGGSSPGETWESLATNELIPFEWVGDATRAFRGCELWRAPTGPSCEPRVLPYPPTLRSCITLASDRLGVTTAEVLAREVYERLMAFGGPRIHDLCWSMAHPSTLSSLELVSAEMLRDRGPAAKALGAATRGLDGVSASPELPGERPTRARCLAFARWASACARAWRDASREGRTATELSRPFSELESPFEPLESLWRLGYGLLPLSLPAIQLLAIEV